MRFPLLELSLLLLVPISVAQVNDYSQYVNPLIGGQGPFEGMACKELVKFSDILYLRNGQLTRSTQLVAVTSLSAGHYLSEWPRLGSTRTSKTSRTPSLMEGGRRRVP
jgi:hypothetical protein